MRLDWRKSRLVVLFQHATQEFVLILDAFWKLPYPVLLDKGSLLPRSDLGCEEVSPPRIWKGLPGSKNLWTHPRKLTAGVPQNDGVWKSWLLLNMPVFGIYDKFLGCRSASNQEKHPEDWEVSHLPSFTKRLQIWRSWETKITVLTNQPTYLPSHFQTPLNHTEC